MYKSNIEARSYNHCCTGNAIRITYCERVLVALVIQHEMRMHYIVMWPSKFKNIFPPYRKNGRIFEKKLKCVF
jgi:hypothetical protein